MEKAHSQTEPKALSKGPTFSQMILNLIEEGKRYGPMEVATHGAVALEDLAIESVGEWAGTAADFGEGVYHELFDGDHVIRKMYLCAAAELCSSSLFRNDTNGIMVLLCRLAATQWFMRQANNKYGSSTNT